MNAANSRTEAPPVLPAASPAPGAIVGGTDEEDGPARLVVAPAERQENAPGAAASAEAYALGGQAAEMVTDFQPDRADPLTDAARALCDALEPFQGSLTDWLTSSRLAPWLLGLALAGGAGELLRRRARKDQTTEEEHAALPDLL
jgi:hypothetical protein